MQFHRYVNGGLTDYLLTATSTRGTRLSIWRCRLKLKDDIKIDTTNRLWDMVGFPTTYCVSVMNKTEKTQLCLE
jgi:hypothetical protein